MTWEGSEEITNYEDVIDSRDIIARIKYLQELEDIPDDEQYELETLLNLQEEAQGSPDWSYGETLIREIHFEDYARELAEDCGFISGDESWPLCCIDWEMAARELQMDYICVNFNGQYYWIRA